MIKLFRKIRQDLLSEGKTTKYFKYAIGEIILVVIGILIALQINNWNEGRKERNLEKKLLLEYKTELDYNYKSLNFAINAMDKRADRCAILLKFIEEDLLYTDSLSYQYSVLSSSLGKSYISSSAFNAIEEKGFDIIKNDSLKNRITLLHTYHYEKLNDRLANQMINIREYGRPIMRHKLKAMGKGKYIPLNYDELMADVSLWNILRVLQGNYRNLSHVITDTQSEIKEVDALIDQYIKQDHD